MKEKIVLELSAEVHKALDMLMRLGTHPTVGDAVSEAILALARSNEKTVPYEGRFQTGLNIA